MYKKMIAEQKIVVKALKEERIFLEIAEAYENSIEIEISTGEIYILEALLGMFASIISKEE